MSRHARQPQHARGAHAKRPNPAVKILGWILVVTLVTVIAPALIGLGLVFGIVWAWLGRGLTKF